MNRTIHYHFVTCALVAASALLTSSCAKELASHRLGSTSDHGYAPVTDPFREMRSLLDAALVRPFEGEVTDGYIKSVTVVSEDRDAEPEVRVLRFGDVAGMKLLEVWGHCRVLVLDQAGKEIFRYEAPLLDDGRRFISVLRDLVARAGLSPILDGAAAADATTAAAASGDEANQITVVAGARL
jgi:hypothetical protein